MIESQTLPALKGKILILGCSTVHGEDVATAVTAVCPDTEVVVADELRTVPRTGVHELVLFDLASLPKPKQLADLRRRFSSSRLIALLPKLTVDSLSMLLHAGCNDYVLAAPEPAFSRQLHEVLERATTAKDPQAGTSTGTYRDFRDLGLIGRSRPIRETFDLIRRAADSQVTILITGERGTGKELVARAVHYNSPRRDGPFVVVNCGAIAETLIESELFGHKRGAFTDAREDRPGKFEFAAGGTIFLDEVTELRPDLQVRLLRVLQEREVTRVGENRPRPVDVRVLAASNRSIEDAIDEGSFRPDLYDRLNVLRIQLPSLRERSRDVVHLAEFFVKRFCEREGKSIEGIAPEAEKVLLAYPWPGNVRELENTIERAVLLARGTHVTVEDLPAEIPTLPLRRTGAAPNCALPYNDAMRRLYDDASQSYVEEVLKRYEGNVTQAARHARIPRESFHRIMRKFGIKSGDSKR